MITPLDRPLRRLLILDGHPYVVTIDPEGVRAVPKGKRKGSTVPWQDIVSGAATLDAQLIASLQGGPRPAETARRLPAARRARSETKRRQAGE